MDKQTIVNEIEAKTKKFLDEDMTKENIWKIVDLSLALFDISWVIHEKPDALYLYPKLFDGDFDIESRLCYYDPQEEKYHHSYIGVVRQLSQFVYNYIFWKGSEKAELISTLSEKISEAFPGVLFKIKGFSLSEKDKIEISVLEVGSSRSYFRLTNGRSRMFVRVGTPKYTIDVFVPELFGGAKKEVINGNYQIEHTFLLKDVSNNNVANMMVDVIKESKKVVLKMHEEPWSTTNV